MLPTDGFCIYEGSTASEPVNPSTAYPRLAKIASAGFALVMNYDAFGGGCHVSDLLAYADYALSVGLKIIWPFHNPNLWLSPTISASYPGLVSDSGGFTTDATFTPWLVNQLKGHPATWGYYIGDEVVASNHSALLTHSNYVHGADATHPRLYIDGAGDPTNAFYAGTSLMIDCCEVGGDDFYPVGDLATWPSTSAIASGIQTYCSAHGLYSAMTLQSFSWQNYTPSRVDYYPGQSPFPSRYQMLQMANDCLANMTPRLMMWYSYFDIVTSDNPTKYWSDVSAVIDALLNKNGILSEPILTYDPFVKPAQTGLGVAPDGSVWSQVGPSTVTVTSACGVKVTGPSTSSTYLLLGSLVADDLTLTYRFVLTSASSSIAGFLVRYKDANNYVRAEISNHDMKVRFVVAGASTYTQSTALGITSNLMYLAKTMAFRNTYYVKVWPENVAEPVAWTLVATDPTGASGGLGQFGMHTFLTNSSDVVLFDSFVAFVTPRYNVSTKGSALTVWYQHETMPVVEIDLYNQNGTAEAWINLQVSQVKVRIRNGPAAGADGQGTVTIVQQNPAVIQYQFADADLQLTGHMQLIVEAMVGGGMKVYPPIDFQVQAD